MTDPEFDKDREVIAAMKAEELHCLANERAWADPGVVSAYNARCLSRWPAALNHIEAQAEQIATLIAERDEAQRQMAALWNTLHKMTLAYCPSYRESKGKTLLDVLADGQPNKVAVPLLNATTTAAAAYEQRIRDEERENAKIKIGALVDDLLNEMEVSPAKRQRVEDAIAALKGEGIG